MKDFLYRRINPAERNHGSRKKDTVLEMRAGLNPDLPESIKGARVVSDFITEYDDLVKAFVAQRQRLQMTVMEVDARSGMQEGYTTKLENYQRSYGRGVGPESLPLWLGGLRLAIVLVELPRAPRNFKDKVRAGIASIDAVEAA